MAIRNPCGATRRPAPAGPERCGLPRRFAPRNDVVIFGWSFFFPMPLASAGRPGGRPLRIPTNNSDARRGRRPRRPTRPTGAVFPMPSASAGGSMPRPYGVSESRRGDPCGRPERRGRRSLRVSFRSTPPQPVGAIHESPAAAKRRFSDGAASGERHGGRSLRHKKSPVSGETGDFHYILFVPIRRAETSDQSGGFTRWISSKIYQARVRPQGLPAKIPRFRRTGG